MPKSENKFIINYVYNITHNYLFECPSEHIDDALWELLCVSATNILDNGIN